MKKSQKRVARFWGVLATGLMLVEEMGELTQAVVKYFRVATLKGKIIPTSKDRKVIIDNLAEEICDVRICLDELEYLLGIEDVVEEWSVKKKKREVRRLKRAKKLQDDRKQV